MRCVATTATRVCGGASSVRGGHGYISAAIRQIEATGVACFGVIVGDGRLVEGLADEVQTRLDLDGRDVPVGGTGSHGVRGAARP